MHWTLPCGGTEFIAVFLNKLFDADAEIPVQLMTLPVSSYEELLVRVRGLTHETIRLQRQLTEHLPPQQRDHNHNERVPNGIEGSTTSLDSMAASTHLLNGQTTDTHVPLETLVRQSARGSGSSGLSGISGGLIAAALSGSGAVSMEGSDTMPGGCGSKERTAREWKEEDATCSSNGDVDGEGEGDDVDGDPDGESAALHSAWGNTGSAPAPLWHSGPSAVGSLPSPQNCYHQDGAMSYSVGGQGAPGNSAASRRSYSQQQLGAKVEMVYGLLSMLGTHDREDMSRTLLAMSSSPDSCVAMRQSGCLPLLVQLLHGREQDPETIARAAQALHNIVNSHPDEKRGRREARVLRLLQMIRIYCDELSSAPKPAPPHAEEGDRNPGPTIAALMKLSFDEEHRHAMCLLGGLHAISYLIQVDHEAHGSTTDDQYCVTLRRYAGMALTNLTFGDGTNKALLCSFRQLMQALVAQLSSPSEDLRQVTASVLRNLSWRADSQSKQTLREVGAVAALMRAAMDAKKESTLKSILSALWNLSAHCSLNKMDVCSVDGALAFLVQMLTYKAPSKTLAIIENAGGILRNISSHVAVREDYRAILRENNCLQILLQQLKSPSLTVVSNACGTLWNLSARCQEDQRALWALGAPGMLRNLIHSKHKMISMGSSAALKNLLSAKPENDDSCFRHVDSTARSLGLTALPGLHARKQKALEQELDQTLAETCDNIEPSVSPTSSTVGLRDDKFVMSLTERDVLRHHRPHKVAPKNRNGIFSRSDSKESVTSTHSDSVYERLARMSAGMDASPMSEPRSFQVPLTLRDEAKLHASYSDSDKVGTVLTRDRNSMSDRRFLKRYHNSMSAATGNDSQVEAASDMNQNASVLDQIVEVENGMASINIDNEPDPTRSEEMRVSPIRAWESEASNVERLSSKEDFHASSGCSEKELDAGATLEEAPKVERASGAHLDVLVQDAEVPDQIVNYSLQYGEDDGTSKVESVELLEEQMAISLHGDTVKTYCTEDTPYETPRNFSSARSREDVREDVAGASQSAERPESSGEETPKGEVAKRVAMNSAQKKQGKPCGNKSDQSASETPLMYSRTSSLASLSNVELRSNVDDRSSVVSDMSRQTSGAISPSELPDSASGIASVRPRSPGECSRSEEGRAAITRTVDSNKCPSVFADGVTTFQEEGTPVQFSTATTSLSSLSFQDASGDQVVPRVASRSSAARVCASRNDGMEKGDAEKELPAVSEREEEYEKVPHVKQTDHPRKPTGIPVRGKTTRHTRSSVELNGVCEDSVHQYCTEDTPANNSCSGSQSDLSVSSHTETCQRLTDVSNKDMSDDACSLSGDNENILAECIQLGMPKAKPQREGSKPSKATPKAMCRQSGSQHVPLVNRVLNRNVFQTENTSAPSCQRLQEEAAPDTMPRVSAEEMYSHEANAGKCNADSLDSSSLTTSIRSSDSRDGLTHLTQSSASEEIVTVLSRNTSLSSLSVESLGREPSPSEQVLLDQCISFGMPKTREVVTPKARASRLPRAADKRPADETSKPVEEPTPAEEKVQPVAEAWIEEKKGDTVDVMKQSTNSNHTWNDDSSPNDISLTSVSITGPTGGSLKSDNYRELSDLVEEGGNSVSEAPDLNSMTDSKMLELEAGRCAEAVQMADSLNSLELDGIQPPSEMDSLVSLSQSYSGNWNVPGHTRRKTLPAGMVARRALSSSGGAIEGDFSLSSSTSHLDNVKAPSLMDDMGDMENSFISVASITSEVADNSVRDSSIGEATFELIRPAAQLVAAACAKEAQKCVTELDNVNQPSTFDDITDIATEQESTLEPGTETLAMDTDLNDDMMDTRTLEAPELPCDSQHTTPASSAESTPKKTRNKKGRPTPKQRREMAPDRYQTYTIDLDKTENTLMDIEDDLSIQSLEEDVVPVKESGAQVRKRITPRQRRQEDRSRFQTQTLPKDVQVLVRPDNDTGTEEESATSTSKTIKSAIPMFRKPPDRSHSRTLSSDSSTTITASLSQTQPSSLTPEDLERDANIVINTLNETQVSAAHPHDELLDCETLSLVSESDSEQNSNSLNNNNGFVVQNEMCPVQPMNINESDTASESDDDGKAVPSRPRIVKPGEEEAVVEVPKGIRGRRKPLYSSARGASRPVVAPRPASSSPPVRASRAPGTIVPVRASSANSTPSPRNMSPRSVVPRRAPVPTVKTPQRQPFVGNKAKAEAQIRPLERQGTFTKDEPTVGILPVSPSKTRIPVPASATFKKPLPKPIAPPLKTSSSNAKAKPKTNTIAPRTPPKNPNSQNYALRKSASASASGAFSRTASVPGAGGPTSPYSKRGSFSGVGSPSGLRMKTSLSNQSLKGHDRSRLEDQRSNSNSSINSTSSSKGSSKVVKKEVTSKIACLWKRVEEGRNQQQRTRDNRVWITPNSKDNTDGSEPADVDSLPAKMVRSATFEGLPTKITVAEEENGLYDEVMEVETASLERKVTEVSGIINGNTTVVLRRRSRTTVAQPEGEGDEEAKRISRVGTFIQIEEGVQPNSQKRVSKSAIVPPYNYYPPQQIDASSVLKRSDSYVNSMGGDIQAGTELETASVRVTTV